MELAQPEALCTALARVGQGFLDQPRLEPSLGLGEHTAVVEERHRHEAAAEQATGDEDQRQHTADLPALLGTEIDTLVAVGFTRDLPPRREVPDGGARV